MELGDTVKLSYVDQSRDDLNDGDTVWEAISGGAEIIELGDAQVNSRAYCSSFNFKGGDQQKKLNLLSGGERNRVHMARLLKEGGNVLLLDEPTNDLDVETCGPWKTRWSTSLAAPSSSRTTASSLTASAPTSSLLRRRPCGVVRRQLRRLRRGQEAQTGTRRAGAQALEA